MKYDNRHLFGFDLVVHVLLPTRTVVVIPLRCVRLPYLTVWESGPKRVVWKVTWFLDCLCYCVEPVLCALDEDDSCRMTAWLPGY